MESEAVRPAPGAGMDRVVRRSPRQRLVRRGLRWGVPAVLAVGLAVLGWRLVPAANTLAVSRDELSIETVRRAPFHDYLPVRAEVAPLHNVFLNAVAGGEVREVLVADGALVQAGQAIARLTNPSLSLDVTSREAAIASQLGAVSAQRLTLQQTMTGEDTQLAEAHYNLLKAQRDLSIRQHLHDQGFASDANVKSYADEAAYYSRRVATLAEARKHDLAIATRQGIEIDQEAERLAHNLAVVEASLDALEVRAPMAGRLTDFDLQPGQSLKAGDRLGQIDGEGAWRLDAQVDEFYLGRVAVGEKAVAEIDGAAVTLTVARVHPQVANGQFRAELTFDRASPSGLRRGESLDCRITLGQTQTALVLPNGAWMEGSGGNSAFAVAANDRAATRGAIATARRNPEQVEITGGLKEGDRVIVSSYAGFKNFDRLSLH